MSGMVYLRSSSEPITRLRLDSTASSARKAIRARVGKIACRAVILVLFGHGRESSPYIVPAADLNAESRRVTQHREEVTAGAGHDEAVPYRVRVAQLGVQHEEHDARRVGKPAGHEQGEAGF